MEEINKEIEQNVISNKWIYAFIIILVLVISLSFYFDKLNTDNLEKTCEKCFGSEWRTEVGGVSRGIYWFECINTITNKTKVGSLRCYNAT